MNRSMARALTVATILALAVPSARAAGQQAKGVYRLTLGDAARLAAERSTPVLEARARTEGAEARVRESRGALLPRLDADLVRGARTFNTASFGLEFPTPPGEDPFFDPRGEVVSPVDALDIRARVELPLVDISALRRRGTAQATADAVRMGEETAASTAARDAATAYLTALRAQAGVAAREEDLALAFRLLDVAQGQLEAGAGVAIDVTRAQAQVATIRAELLVARHAVDITALALRRTLRLPDDAVLELMDELGSMSVAVPPSEGAAISSALETRPELSMAEAYRSAADQSLSATRAGRLPRLSASLDDGFYGTGFGGPLLNTYSWSLRVSVPVFEGFTRSARIQEQQAQLKEIGYRIEDLEEEVTFEVRRALLNLDASQQLAAAAGERLRLSQLEVEQEEERVRAGVSGMADLVPAATRLNEARTGQINALAAVQLSRVALAAAMGVVSDLP
jgi:outer membrane protein TolC